MSVALPPSDVTLVWPADRATRWAWTLRVGAREGTIAVTLVDERPVGDGAPTDRFRASAAAKARASLHTEIAGICLNLSRALAGGRRLADLKPWGIGLYGAVIRCVRPEVERRQALARPRRPRIAGLDEPFAARDGLLDGSLDGPLDGPGDAA